MPKPRKDPYKPRPCRFCKLEFKPTTKNPKNADEQQFCCAGHRKEFWKHGKLPFHKLQLSMEKRMREIAREEGADTLSLSLTNQYRVSKLESELESFRNASIKNFMDQVLSWKPEQADEEEDEVTDLTATV